jgi:hypothetical protein
MPTQLPPPPGKPSRKGEPPSLDATKGNLDKPEPGGQANLNFKVSAEFKRDFKIAAATIGKSQVDFLQEVYEYWARNHG